MSAGHNPLQDSQAEEPAYRCDQCDAEIRHGDTAYKINGLQICGECFKAHIEYMLDGFPHEVADQLNIDYEEV